MDVEGERNIKGRACYGRGDKKAFTQPENLNYNPGPLAGELEYHSIFYHLFLSLVDQVVRDELKTCLAVL